MATETKTGLLSPVNSRAIELIDQHIARRLMLHEGLDDTWTLQCQALASMVPKVGYGQSAMIRLDQGNGALGFQSFMGDCATRGVLPSAWISPENPDRETLRCMGLLPEKVLYVYECSTTSKASKSYHATRLQFSPLRDYDEFKSGHLQHPSFYGASKADYQYRLRRAEWMTSLAPMTVVDMVGRFQEGVMAAGTLITIGETASLWSLGVVPSLRGMGLGREMVEALRATAAKMGCKNLVWIAEEKLLGFYRRCGFSPAGTMEFWNAPRNGE